MCGKVKSVPKSDYEALSSRYNETVTACRLHEEKAVTQSSLNIALTGKLNDRDSVIAQLQNSVTASGVQLRNSDEKIAGLSLQQEIKQRFSLEAKVKDLIEHTNRVSAEASNLAVALKGRPQKRGNWGEMILERILESSGLTKDREYFIQQSVKDEEGAILRPDVLVSLPDDRTVIIDSKVSLIAYDKFIAADDPDEQKRFLAEHVSSTTNHINQLSAKNYDSLAFDQ